MSSSSRPKWVYALPREIFKKLDSTLINCVKLTYKMLTEDTSQSYLTFFYDEDPVLKIEADNKGFWELFELRKNPYSNLLSLTYEGSRAQNLSDDIDEFDDSNAAEYETYLRLKSKYEP